MARNGTSFEQKIQSRSSETELLARGVLEQRDGQRFSEKEWAERRRRLVEFVLTLARWDAEHHRTGNSVATAITPGSRDGDKKCNPIKQPNT